MPVYLLCLSRKLNGHAKHYLGATANIPDRLERHRSGRGSAMLRACNQRGIRYSLVRRWPGGFLTEKRLKRLKSRDLCPRCSGRAAYLKGRV